MNQPFIAFLVAITCISQSSEVTAQHTIAGSGDLGSTTSDGNAYWVAAQLAMRRGENEVAFTSSDRACQAGTAIACAVAGEMIVQGKTQMGTPEQAVALFQRGCDLRNANACQGLGLMLVQGIGVAADAKKGQRVMETACQAGSAMACANLGLMLKMGFLGQPNPTEAQRYFSQALALQPNNEVALQAMNDQSQSVQHASSKSSQPNPPVPRSQIKELRGRIAVRSPTAAGAREELASCWESVSAHWNLARESGPRKPTWNALPPTHAAQFDDAQTMATLILLATKAGATIPTDTPTLAACQSHFEPILWTLLRQPWSIAPNDLSKNSLVQINPLLQFDGSAATAEQTILIMVQTNGGNARRPLYADRGFALYRVNCNAAAVTPVFYFQTDGEGKLASSAGTAAPPTLLADRAQRLGCAGHAERLLWTQLSSFEAALSIRFEQDQQQTP